MFLFVSKSHKPLTINCLCFSMDISNHLLEDLVLSNFLSVITFMINKSDTLWWSKYIIISHDNCKQV